jgi:hypothetical protein
MKKKVKLEDLDRKDIFTTPEGYFDQLPGRIHERMALQETKDDRPVYRLVPKRVYYIAASVAVFLIATVLVLREPKETTTSAQNMLAEVSTEAMIEYLEMSDVSVTDITLAEDEQQQLLEDQWQHLIIPEEDTNEITTEELDEYL